MPKAARFYRVGEPLKIEEVPVPKLSSNEVLLKIRAASMCHSDVHVTTGVIQVQGPVTLGHEIAGEVEEIGNDVTNVRKGERAVVHFITPCGDCDMCLQGKSTSCRNIYSKPMYGFSADGGYAEYIKVDADRIVALPQEVSYEFGASLGCAGITAIHAVNSIAKVKLGDTVAVYGTGGVGMYVSQLAKLSGARVIAIGRTEEKLEMVQKQFGADAAVNISKEKLRDGVKKITGGKGVDAVFDFVVNAESMDNSMKILANSGMLVLVGVGDQPVPINPKALTLKENSVAGSFVGSKRELQLLTELAQAGKLRGITSTKYSLEQVNEALIALKEGKIVGRAYFN